MYLVSGDWRGGHQPFLASRRLEREADWFAAALLMPRQSFIAEVQKIKGLCRLRDLAALAERVFQTSLLSAALRYVQMNFAPCCMILSEGSQARFAMPSDALRDCRLGELAGIPEESVTGRLLAARKEGRWTKDRGLVAANLWFLGAQELPLWEEVRILGRTGLTLTYLVLCSGEQGGNAEADRQTVTADGMVRVSG
jgi:hypothetical protein